MRLQVKVCAVSRLEATSATLAQGAGEAKAETSKFWLSVTNGHVAPVELESERKRSRRMIILQR